MSRDLENIIEQQRNIIESLYGQLREEKAENGILRTILRNYIPDLSQKN
tara:strand:- start:1921 stop:2067 length:147 start_codon:yes stop_codon:yes gene_type:complete